MIKNLTLEELAGLVSKMLHEHAIDSVLVGGACVTIYTNNRYQSFDLDYVTYENIRKVENALKKIGFTRKGNTFSHPESKYFIEFVSPPVAIGEELIRDFSQHRTPLGSIKMLTPTDSVKDRLASFFHWKDSQSLEQAIMICKDKHNHVNLREIKRWSQKEGFIEDYKKFHELLKAKG